MTQNEKLLFASLKDLAYLANEAAKEIEIAGGVCDANIEDISNTLHDILSVMKEANDAFNEITLEDADE